MGCLLSKQKKYPPKEGYKFINIKDEIKPLDIILFKGPDFVSNLIRCMEGFKVGTNTFSHAGMIVTSDILNDPRLEKGKLYIWESTMSGKLGEGVTNIDGKSFLGVQLRDFEEVLKKYDENPKTRIALCRLKEGVCPIKDNELKDKFTDIFDKYNGTFYDANIFSLMGALFPWCRPIRTATEHNKIKDWLFCSELVALCYKELGIYPEEVNPKDVVPVDFLEDEKDTDGAPKVTEEIKYIIY
jgi:hypothetical protein